MKCRARYKVFKEHYGTLLRLKQVGARLDDCGSVCVKGPDSIVNRA